MSYGLSNLIYSCRQPEDESFIQKSNRVTLVTDVLLCGLFVGAAITLGLMLKGVIPVSLSSGMRTLTEVAFWTSIGAATTTILANLAVALIKSKKQCVTLESLKEAILQTKTVNPTPEESRIARKVPCNQIINGLFLGQASALMESTRLTCYTPNGETEKLEQLKTSNPRRFETIISVCPLAACTMNFYDGEEKSLTKKPSDFEKFLAKNVKWLNVGEMFSDPIPIDDRPDAWAVLVHDCTFLDKDRPSSEPSLSDEAQKKEVNACVALKKEIIMGTDDVKGIDVEEWFQPTFDQIDEAVFEGRKTLVHCQAGQSRSAALLAAYFINRCRVSHTQALAFLKSKRICVECKFEKQLKDYATALGISTDS